jgi:hypothetical protein
MKKMSAWLIQLAIASLLTIITVPVSAGTDEPYLRLNEVNIHAVRDFKNRFATITTDKWLRLDNGYLAKFNSNGISNQVYYDNNGTFILRTRYFTERTMPAELKQLFQHQFAGYNILMVTEVADEKQNFYRINIKNTSSVKTLQVVNAEVTILEDWRNGEN